MEISEFKKDQCVQWGSASRRRLSDGSFSSHREGVALLFIPANTYLCDLSLPDEYLKAKPSRCCLGNGKYGESQNDRVLVRVQEDGAKGQKLTPKYYAPQANRVKVIDD